MRDEEESQRIRRVQRAQDDYWVRMALKILAAILVGLLAAWFILNL